MRRSARRVSARRAQPAARRAASATPAGSGRCARRVNSSAAKLSSSALNETAVVSNRPSGAGRAFEHHLQHRHAGRIEGGGGIFVACRETGCIQNNRGANGGKEALQKAGGGGVFQAVDEDWPTGEAVRGQGERGRREARAMGEQLQGVCEVGRPARAQIGGKLRQIRLGNGG